MQSILEKLRAKIESDKELQERIRLIVSPVLEHTKLLKFQVIDGEEPPEVRPIQPNNWPINSGCGSHWHNLHTFVISFGADWLLEYLFTPRRKR